VEVKFPRARRIYLIGRFVPEDEEICETGAGTISNYELRITDEGAVREGGAFQDTGDCQLGAGFERSPGCGREAFPEA
jgi:hypothetical protein